MLTTPNSCVLHHVVDVHCHPTDAPTIQASSMEKLEITICAMSTTHSDQHLVRDLAEKYPDKVIPCFGYHPWFAHHISLHPELSKEAHYQSLFLPSTSPSPSHVLAFQTLLPHLPDPIPLSIIMSTLRHNLTSFPRAMLGEVGLDRSFRVALEYATSPRELTPFTIPFDHQLAILEAQLEVAIELGRNVSMHSVKTQLGTLDLFGKMIEKYGEKWNRISVDMHSCGLSPQMWSDIEKRHSNIYLSLSTAINVRPNSSNHKPLIEACADNRILVESDFHDVDDCTQRTWDMVGIVAEVKGWTIEEEWNQVGDDVNQWGVVRRLEANWRSFERGGHVPVQKKWVLDHASESESEESAGDHDSIQVGS